MVGFRSKVSKSRFFHGFVKLAKHPVLFGFICAAILCLSLLIFLPNRSFRGTLVKVGDAELPSVPTVVDNKTEHLQYNVVNPGLESSGYLTVDAWFEVGNNGIITRDLIKAVDSRTGQLVSYHWTTDSSVALFSYSIEDQKICKQVPVKDERILVGNIFVIPITSMTNFRQDFLKKTVQYIADTSYQGQQAKVILTNQLPTSREVSLIDPKTMLIFEDASQKRASTSTNDWQDLTASNLISREFTDPKPADFYQPSPLPDAPISDCAS